MAEAEKVLELYRDRYFDFNVRHFHDKRLADGRPGGEEQEARPCHHTGGLNPAESEDIIQLILEIKNQGVTQMVSSTT